MNKIVEIYKDDNYSLILEYIPTVDYFLFHCYVFNWNKTIYKEMKGRVPFLKQLLNNILNKEYIYTQPQNRKFAVLFGFEEAGDYLLLEDGSKRELLRWDLKQQH